MTDGEISRHGLLRLHAESLADLRFLEAVEGSAEAQGIGS